MLVCGSNRTLAHPVLAKEQRPHARPIGDGRLGVLPVGVGGQGVSEINIPKTTGA